MDDATREREIRDMIYNGLAEDHTQAVEILAQAQQRRARADLYIFYRNAHLVRPHLGQYLVDEQPYCSSTVLLANVPSGVISQVASSETLALGALKEFVDKDATLDQAASLVAFVRNFPFRGKSGIFFSPFSAEAVHARGHQTVDEREGLWRIEFQPIADDYVLGMFGAWHQQPEAEHIALVLYLHRSRVMAY